MVSSYRLGLVFFATEKGLSPRGYERNEIIHAWWVPPSTFLWLVILNN
ncbi:hypothetical protein [Daejeonella sp.]